MQAPLAICEHCDAVHRRAPIPRGSRAYCQRCGGELYSNRTTHLDTLVALSITALIVFVVANVFPIVEVRLGAERSEATLLGAVATSWNSGVGFVAAMAGAMVFLFPLMLIVLSLYLFLPLRMGWPVPGFGTAMYLLQQVRPWSMVEVFMLGVVVALVKLSADADIYLAPGLWGFATLTVLMTLLNTVDMHELWAMHGRQA